MPTRYYLSLPDPAQARGNDADLAFTANGADGLAAELQDALRSDGLFLREVRAVAKNYPDVELDEKIHVAPGMVVPDGKHSENVVCKPELDTQATSC